jgi:hypothetical protein
LWKRPQRRVVWSHDMSILDFSLHTRRGARYQLRVRINKLGQLGWQARAQSTKRERRNADHVSAWLKCPFNPPLANTLKCLVDTFNIDYDCPTLIQRLLFHFGCQITSWKDFKLQNGLLCFHNIFRLLVMFDAIFIILPSREET